MTNRKQFITTFFCFIFILIFTTLSKANSEDKINSIDITVQILENGDAKITEEWQVYNGSSGTEWYRPIDNLNHMGLKDFKVWFDGWEGVNEYDNWIVHNNFNYKMNRFGIHNINKNSFELCWGKTKRNTDITYKIEYIYTNFVQQFLDGNGFNVKFVNDDMDPAPKRVSLIIKPYKGEFNRNNSKIWAFGTNRGKIEFKEGKIVFNGKNFKRVNYLTVLVGSNDVTLPASYKGKGTLENLKNKALEGSDYGNTSYLKEKIMIMIGRYDGSPFILTLIFTLFFILIMSAPNSFKWWFKILATLIFFGLPFVLEINMFITSFPILGVIFASLGLSKTKIKLPKELEKYEEYNRESILKYSFKDMYSLSKDIGKIHISKDSLISAVIMNLINKDVLEIEDGINDNVRLRVKDPAPLNDSIEDGIVKAIYEKYGDKFVNADRIGKALYNSQDISYDLNSYELPDLKVEEQTEGLSIFINRLTLNEEYIPMIEDILGMQNYLKDFTLIGEKEIRDITICQSYLVMATLLNMPYEVIKALEGACPQPEILKTRHYRHLSGNQYPSSRVSQSYSNISRSSGGGGRSSSGGGGGSSGGGSGGGSR